MNHTTITTSVVVLHYVVEIAGVAIDKYYDCTDLAKAKRRARDASKRGALCHVVAFDEEETSVGHTVYADGRQVAVEGYVVDTEIKSDVDFIADQIFEGMISGRVYGEEMTPKAGGEADFDRAKAMLESSPSLADAVASRVDERMHIHTIEGLLHDIEMSADLKTLKYVLREAHDYAFERGISVEDIYEEWEVPKFAGDDPDESGCVSWDQDSMLVSYDNWSIVPRPMPDAGPVQRVVLHDPHAGL